MSNQANACAQSFVAALANNPPLSEPFRHWRLTRVLPGEVLDAINALDLVAPSWQGADGRRAWNAARVFVDQDMQARLPQAAALAEAFQSQEALAAVESHTGLDLTGLYLRIEYCLDSQGFWLEPHTDIGVKRLTLQVYCARDAAAHGWGSSIYDTDRRWTGNIDGSFANAMMFVPANDTWHGFEPRRIDGVRRSLIVNFVTADWQNRGELAFPDQPVAPHDQR
jgi:hypothetical protein